MEKSTNNKHHFEISVLLSTSFPASGPEEKKKKKKKDPAGDAAPVHLLLHPVQFVADSHENSCGEGVKEGERSAEGRNISKCDADDLGIRSSRYLAAPRQSEHSSCLFGRPPTSP